MNEHTAVVIGASGLVGSCLLEELLNDPLFDKVRVLLRKPLPLHHPKLVQELVNFDDTSDYENKFGKGDVIFCCMGTTLKKVKGDKEAYYSVDYDIPVNAARIGLSLGYSRFLMVSSIGANPHSSNFYLQLKGKTEEAVEQFKFSSVYIFRPSILLGSRNERRPAEKISQAVMNTFSFLFIGPLKKIQSYKGRACGKSYGRSIQKRETWHLHM